MERKGQMDFEMIVALFVLILLVGTSAVFWMNIQRTYDNKVDFSDKLEKATLAFDSILGDANTERGGIVNEKREIDSGKLTIFVNSNYDTLKETLLVGNYDFYFRIYDSSTTYAQKGSQLTTDAVALQRPMKYNEKPVKGEFILYDQEEDYR